MVEMLDYVFSRDFQEQKTIRQIANISDDILGHQFLKPI